MKDVLPDQHNFDDNEFLDDEEDEKDDFSVSDAGKAQAEAKMHHLGKWIMKNSKKHFYVVPYTNGMNKVRNMEIKR